MQNALRRIAAFVITTVVVWRLLSLSFPLQPVAIHARWASGLADAQRTDLERRFRLWDSEWTDGTTWGYRLAKPSTDTIRAVVRNEQLAAGGRRAALVVS
jgi:hypothetical protein